MLAHQSSLHTCRPLQRIAGRIVWIGRQVQVRPRGRAAERAQRHRPGVDEQQARARQLARQQRAWQALQRDLDTTSKPLTLEVYEGFLTGFQVMKTLTS